MAGSSSRSGSLRQRPLGIVGGCIVLGGLFGAISGLILAIGTIGIKIAIYCGVIAGLFVGTIGAILLRKKSLIGTFSLVFWTGAPATILSTLRWSGEFHFVVGIPVGAIILAMVLGAVFLEDKLYPRGLCPRCGYDLRGSLRSGRCPECGTLFDKSQDA